MFALFKDLKPYRLGVIFVMLFTLGAILLELFLPTLMADIVDVGIVNEDLAFIFKTGAFMIGCAIFAIVLSIGVTFFASKVAQGFARDLRKKLFVHVEHFSLEEFDRIGPASLITRTTNDIKQVQDVLNMMLRMMTRAPFMLIGGIILAVYRDAKLSLIFLAVLPVLAFLIFFISRKAIPLFSALQKKTDRLNLILRESLIGVRVVRAFNRVDYEKKRFNQANEDYRDTGIQVNKILAFVFPIMMIIMNVTSVAIIWFGGIRIDAGTMFVGNMMAFLQYAMMILMSLIMLSMGFVMIPRAQASANRIQEVLLMHSHIKDPVAEEQPNEQQPILVFDNVTFRYPGAEKPALDSISFQANVGETIAIIGSTGSGKSTLVQLIPRFYDVEQGKILVRGVDVRAQTQESLRSLIGYVPQRAAIFQGTIADNVKFGNGDLSEQQINEALTTAQAMEFVSNLENGIQAKVSQGGANLSGGQKQRLSISRALARKPEIYIFDDSFSALDYKTDRKLRDALVSETKNALQIIVAQRVTTVMNADQIIVLNEGVIVGVGTHEQLLASNQVYQEIVASQQIEEVGA